jgi:CBS domain-containing protein
MSDDRNDVPVAGGAATVVVFSADNVATVAPDATLLDVAKELVLDEVGLLVVGTPERVEGVVSERDVVRAVAAGNDPAATPVSAVASTRVVWCDPTTTVDEAAQLMMAEYVRHVLVEDDGRLIGIVSARDLLGAYAADAASTD